ncbi:hypothetical protein BVRB_1g008300 [Beta vulgaris subsp. vulgaris]|nr:hypothetical protein BVRB_1g008300 [Beta vulgaris subsp. vulgaris]
MPWISQAHYHGFLLYLLFLLLTPPITAQQQPPDDDQSSQKNYNSPMATALIVMIIVFFSVGFISVYLRHVIACLGIRNYNNGRRRGGGGGGGRWTRESPRGLDPTLVNSFPTFLYSDVKVHRVGKTTPLECAICINEFSDHEILRLLPKCSHVFHPHCIGPWLASHVTCPVCRANLELQAYDNTNTNNNTVQIIHQMSEDESEPSDQIINNDNDVIVRVEPSQEVVMKSPTQELIKGLSESGRMGLLPRSHSTGHSFVEDCERFTLRLPEEVRNKLVNVNLLTGLPAAIVSPRVGYRARSLGFTNTQLKNDGWRFSVSPPFISRPGSPKLEASNSNGNDNGNGKNNALVMSTGILRSPRNIFNLMKSPNKSPLNRVVSCNDIGERSSDRLWENNPVCQEQNLEDRR